MALSLSAQPQLRARQSRFAGVALRARAPAARAAPRAAAAVPPTRAGIFDFLTPKASEEPASAAAQAYICIDCGYVYRCAAAALRRKDTTVGKASERSFFYPSFCVRRR
jgi:hypothetical protein